VPFKEQGSTGIMKKNSAGSVENFPQLQLKTALNKKVAESLTLQLCNA
jgi:hypothetical protein